MDYGDRAIPTIHIETQTLHSSCIPRDNRDHMKGKKPTAGPCWRGTGHVGSTSVLLFFFLFFFTLLVILNDYDEQGRDGQRNN